MAKKVVIPKYEQMILDIAIMNAEQLETVVRCAKKMLTDMRPKTQRKKKAVSAAVQEKAS